MKKLDLTGQSFGDLIVLKESGDRALDGSVVWLCKCRCGNTCSVSANSLRTGKTKSCGCRRFEARANLAWQQFGDLMAISPVEDKKSYSNSAMWCCLCICGRSVHVLAKDLLSGHVKSCGCRHEYLTTEEMKHLGQKWNGMKRRCYNKRDSHYPVYGGRGIGVCQEWRQNSLPFVQWALDQPSYKPGLTINRIDNDRGYSPDNCDFITMAEQAKNKRK